MEKEQYRPNPLDVDAIARLQGLLHSLSPSESQIGEYILKNHEAVLQMTLADVAANSGVSDATAVRFFRSIGYNRWLDFKIALSQSSITSRSMHDQVRPEDPVDLIANKVIQGAISALEQTAAVLDPVEIEKAVDYLQHANKILIAGAGTSLPVAQEMFNRLFRLGLNVSIEPDSYLQVMQCSLLNPGDVLVAISQTGESYNTIRTVTVARENGCAVICITGNRLSELAKLSDAVLLSASHEVLQETIASRIAQHTLTHVLYISLAVRCMEKSLQNEHTIWNALVGTIKKD